MKKDNPLVSVIMSEYNTDEILLINSINSIINQTYSNLEIILIDDCGKNNVEQIVRDINDNRVKVYKNKTNSGLVYSLNKAIRLSKGKYIARMDTDDWSYPNRIETEVDFLEIHTEYDLVSGNALRGNEKEELGYSNYSGEVTRKKLLKGNPIIHPTILARKDAFIKVGLYPNFKRCEDYAMWIRFYSNGCKMYTLPDVLIKYHLSLSDYSKRKLKTRSGFFELIKTDYKLLKPSFFDSCRIYLKNVISGILPYKIMYKFHKKSSIKEK